jgi:hypothetical protein
MLGKNLDKVNWKNLSSNPSIYQIDYNVLRENFHEMSEEIAKIVWHPIRMSKWPEDCLIDEHSDSDECYDSDADHQNNMQNISITSTIRYIKLSIRHRLQ